MYGCIVVGLSDRVMSGASSYRPAVEMHVDGIFAESHLHDRIHAVTTLGRTSGTGGLACRMNLS